MRSSLFSSSPNEFAARRAWPPGLNWVHSGRIAQSSLSILPKDHRTTSHQKPLTSSTWQREFGVAGGVMLGAWGVGRSSSWLGVWKRRLLGAVALGALPLPGGLTSRGPAWGQI